MATLVVKRLVESGSVRAGDIGVITPYEAQTSLIKAMLQSESLGDVEAATIDVFRVASMKLLFSLLCGPTQAAASVTLMMAAAPTSHLHGPGAV